MPRIIPPKPSKLTQKQKILILMCRHPNKWFYPYEFMKPHMGILYVGYKAPTRIAELHHDIPCLFETKQNDKYMQRRLNISKIGSWYDMLPVNLKDIVDQYLTVGGCNGRKIR